MFVGVDAHIDPHEAPAKSHNLGDLQQPPNLRRGGVLPLPAVQRRELGRTNAKRDMLRARRLLRDFIGASCAGGAEPLPYANLAVGRKRTPVPRPGKFQEGVATPSWSFRGLSRGDSKLPLTAFLYTASGAFFPRGKERGAEPPPLHSAVYHAPHFSMFHVKHLVFPLRILQFFL